jgi:dGTPase
MMQWNSCFSNIRWGSESETASDRSVYERDWDRMVFSSAFRRLQNKTQVFPLPKASLVHNRLTHSLEVASVGRSLGQMAGEWLSEHEELNSSAREFYLHHLKNVIASACLAHDLGNPPFGHAGEEAISKYFIDHGTDSTFRNLFSDAEWADLIQFEGNAHALRVLTQQRNGRPKGGFGLTRATLVSILKYPCEARARDKSAGIHRKKYGFFQSEKSVFLELAESMGMIRDSDQPLSYRRHPFVYFVEAADDICYSIIDLEDAHRLGIIPTGEVVELLMGIITQDPHYDAIRVSKTISDLEQDPNEHISYLRAKAISALTQAAFDGFTAHAEDVLQGTLNCALIDLAAHFTDALEAIRARSYRDIYNHPTVAKIELAGFKIMSGLIEDFVEAVLVPPGQAQTRHKKVLALLPKQFEVPPQSSPYQKAQSIIDFAAGMTDDYALNLYKNLRGIELPGL